jgi:hypothetical protein
LERYSVERKIWFSSCLPTYRSKGKEKNQDNRLINGGVWCDVQFTNTLSFFAIKKLELKYPVIKGGE